MPLRHLEKKNEVSLFLAFADCSRCSFGTDCRNCEGINPYYDFSVSKRNGLQPPPSRIKSISFGNELRTLDMIPYVYFLFTFFHSNYPEKRGKESQVLKTPIILWNNIFFIQWGINEIIKKAILKIERKLNEQATLFFFSKKKKKRKKKNIRNGTHCTQLHLCTIYDFVKDGDGLRSCSFAETIDV